MSSTPPPYLPPPSDPSGPWLPGPIECYERAWRLFSRQWLLLSVIVLVAALFHVPGAIANEAIPYVDDKVLIAAIWVSTTLFSLLVANVVTCGAEYAALKAARGETVALEDLFAGFSNYIHVVLVYFLLQVAILIGLLCCIVPGIFIACRFYYATLYAVDRRMPMIEAFEASWKLTSGQGFNVFLIGLIACPVMVLGAVACCIGIFPASAFVMVAFGVLYAQLVPRMAGAVSTILPPA